MTQNYLTTWERRLPLDNEQQPFARNDEMRVGRSLWLTPLNLLRIFFFLTRAKADLYEAFGYFGRHNSRPLV